MLVLWKFKVPLWIHLVQNFCLLGGFWFIVSISLVKISLFRFSDSSWLSFRKLYVSKNLSISSRLSYLLAYSCSQYFLIILCVSLKSVVTSSVSFLMLFIWVLSLFFLMSLLKCLSVLFVFPRTSSWFHWSFVLCYLNSILFIPVLIFIISFLISMLGFVTLFLIPLSIMVNYLLEIFLVLEVGL